MPLRIIPIVEGHGEVAAVPILLRRIAEALEVQGIQVGRPIRCQRQKLMKPGELERAVELAALKCGSDGRLLLLIDGDKDCPAELGPELLARARIVRNDIPRSGGSIPVVGTFQKFLKAPSVMMGFGLPDDNLHAPNEKFHIPNFYRGIETVGRFLELLGQ
jgi:hypothetical protein